MCFLTYKLWYTLKTSIHISKEHNKQKKIQTKVSYPIHAEQMCSFLNLCLYTHTSLEYTYKATIYRPHTKVSNPICVGAYLSPWWSCGRSSYDLVLWCLAVLMIKQMICWRTNQREAIMWLWLCHRDITIITDLHIGPWTYQELKHNGNWRYPSIHQQLLYCTWHPTQILSICA